MPNTVIVCADCGTQYPTKRKNTKYCRLCRINRNLQFYGQRVSKCWACEEKFAPYDANQTVCGSCLFVPQSAPAGHCGLCKTDKQVLHSDVAVCHACALDPTKRSLFMRAVATKASKRAAA